MTMNVLIKDHKTGAYEFIANKRGLPEHEIVEAWQKKQYDYLLRGQMRSCSWKAIDGGLIDAMKQSKSLV